MPTYVRKANSDTWHWCTNCSRRPKEIAKRERLTGKTRPRSGELCDECKGKERNGTARLS